MTTIENRYHAPTEAQPLGQLPTSHEVISQVTQRLQGFCAGDYETALTNVGVGDTPLYPAPQLSGNDVYEADLTRHLASSSYKIFGVAVKTLLSQNHALSNDMPGATRLLGASAGNHGEALAAMASSFGCSALVMTARDASPKKIALMEALKAKVDSNYDELSDAQRAAEEAAKEPGSLLIPPYDDYDVLTGQAIIGIRVVNSLIKNGVTGDVVSCVPIGGGGFATGQIIGSRFALQKAAAEGYDASSLNLTFVGVQMEDGDPARRAVHAYRNNLPWEKLTDLFPDGRYDKTNDGTFAIPGVHTLPVLADQEALSSIRTVPKGRVGLAMAALLSRHGRMYEPAGSLSSALAYTLAKEADRKTTFVTYLTGANVDESRFTDYLQAGAVQRRDDMLAASHTLKAPSSDTPRALDSPATIGRKAQDIYGSVTRTSVASSPVTPWGRR